jgi:hypothetical protein
MIKKIIKKTYNKLCDIFCICGLHNYIYSNQSTLGGWTYSTGICKKCNKSNNWIN